MKAGQRPKAIELLTKQINQQPTNKLHHILGKSTLEKLHG